MDLSSIEGLELSEDQQKQILALHETETKGLRENRDSLLQEKQQIKTAAEEAQAKAKAEAEKAAIAEAKKAGDLKALEKSLSEQFSSREESLNSELSKYKEMVLGGKKDAVVSELSGMFTSPEAAKMILGQMIEVSPGDNGTVTTFKDRSGNVVSTDKEMYVDWLKKQDAFKTLIKGVESSGGGANGGLGGSGGAAPQGDWAAKNAARINARLKKR